MNIPGNMLKINEYIDENGTVWSIPTAEAYARVCKANEFKKQTINALLSIVLKDHDHDLDKFSAFLSRAIEIRDKK